MKLKTSSSIGMGEPRLVANAGGRSLGGEVYQGAFARVLGRARRMKRLGNLRG